IHMQTVKLEEENRHTEDMEDVTRLQRVEVIQTRTKIMPKDSDVSSSILTF
ncbi:hypothetical protein AVEN_172211-1, partial [Araneus ventricosus]